MEDLEAALHAGKTIHEVVQQHTPPQRTALVPISKPVLGQMLMGCSGWLVTTLPEDFLVVTVLEDQATRELFVLGQSESFQWVSAAEQIPRIPSPTVYSCGDRVTWEAMRVVKKLAIFGARWIWGF